MVVVPLNQGSFWNNTASATHSAGTSSQLRTPFPSVQQHGATQKHCPEQGEYRMHMQRWPPLVITQVCVKTLTCTVELREELREGL